MDSTKDLLENLTNAISAAKALIHDIKVVTGTSRLKRVSMILFNNLAEKADSVRVLVAAGNGVGLELITRSAFETYLDIINLYLHRPQYEHYLLYMSAEQQRKSLQAIVNYPDSPFSKSIADHTVQEVGLTVDQMLAGTDAELQLHKAKLSKTYMDGKRKASDPQAKVNTSVQLRSELAGRQNEYESIYRMLSRSTHSDIAFMLRGIIKGRNFVWPPNQTKPSILAIDFITGMLLDTSVLIAKKLNRPAAHINAIGRARQEMIQKMPNL